ncbi:MAG: hypothetical protein HC800_05070 [Phormidesmis sp. RL_2_1]|nr:hypothetical protein [Phormidesmis sp. RL_2_1]
MNANTPKSGLSLVLSEFWEAMFPKVDAYAVPVIVERIQEWVGEQPFLTQIVCNYVIQHLSRGMDKASVVGISESEASAIVDRVIQSNIIDDWKRSTAAKHLEEISKILLDYDRRDSLLILYIQILQRKTVPANNSPEQDVLLRSGLIRLEDGQLRVANALYPKIFDLAWVEQQLPGITRPVAIVNRARHRGLFTSGWRMDDKSASAFGLYWKLALAACGLVWMGAAISSYFRTPNSPALANSEAETINNAEVRNSVRVSANNANNLNNNASISDRDLFDSGIENARNSRWVATMRAFCSISTGSTYFAPAQKQLEQWMSLYPEEVQIARDTVVQEKSSACAIATDVLTSPTP